MWLLFIRNIKTIQCWVKSVGLHGNGFMFPVWRGPGRFLLQRQRLGSFLLIYNHQFSSNIYTIFLSAVSDSETDRKQCSGWTLGWAAWGNDVTMTINSEIGVVGWSIIFQRMVPLTQCKYAAECGSPSSVLHWCWDFLHVHAEEEVVDGHLLVAGGSVHDLVKMHF